MKVRLVAGCMGMALILLLFFGTGVAKAADDEGKLNLNAASVEELSKIPGLNRDLAQKIVDLREENGEFIDMEELLDIPGIDNSMLRKLKKHLFIEAVDDCNC